MRLHFSPSLRQRHARFETRKSSGLGAWAVEDHIVGREYKGEWNPGIESCGILNLRRRNPDDRKALSIELNRLPDRVRGVFEPLLPEPRTDHSDPPIFMLLLLRPEESTCDGAHAQCLKKICAYIQRFDPFGLSPARQIDAASVSAEDGNLLEALHTVPPPPGALIRVRVLPLNTWPVDPDQLRRLAIGQRAD